MKAKNIISTALIASLGALIGVFIFTRVIDKSDKMAEQQIQPVHYAKLPVGPDAGVDFTHAAERTVEGVVHVKTQSVKYQYYRNPLYEFFYGESYREAQPVVGFGSGVIVSPKGYIVTNNHVINKAEQIFVTLNDNREFEAELIGTDPTSDLALIKIDAEDLTFIPWGSSDDLKLGEWVLAVGNPFNLTSTVTAGIVSAKGRSLGIIKENYRLESFIQTDAAVNQGNSGGALVNIQGELVGINTAILSPSGAYAGTSFAIPVDIVKKIVEDLIEYGEVQRAILGVSIQDVTSELAKEKDLDIVTGVYVSGLQENGAAKDAGIKVGDVITAVNGVKVKTAAELQEQIGRYRPKEEVEITLLRNGKEKAIEVILRNMEGDAKLVVGHTVIPQLGAKVEKLSDKSKKELGINNGVKIVELLPGKLRREGVREGFIITKINNQPVQTAEDIAKIIKDIKGGVYIEGVYPDGVVAYYAFGLD